MRLDHLLSKEEEEVGRCCLLFSYQGGAYLYIPSKGDIGILVAMRLGETPVPIPNTMVKPQTADGTALETVWESRWPPDHKKQKEDSREASWILILSCSSNKGEMNYSVKKTKFGETSVL